MDSAQKEIIKRNEKLISSLDIHKLAPLLREHKIFTKSMLKDICKPYSGYSLYSELPTRGPLAFQLFIEVLKKTGYQNEVNTLLNPPKYDVMRYSDTDFYPMNSKPLGYCLIINNETFTSHEYREGSKVDVDNLVNFFKKIGYEVNNISNLKGNKIKRWLEDCSKSSFSKTVNSCFIFILSHGGTIRNADVIYGTDGVSVEKAEIINIFNNINCESLRLKPKLFFFQACRGEDEDEGEFIKEGSDSVKVKKIPSLTDTLVVHSSLPHFKSYRSFEEGSWLIQDLVSVLQDKYLYEDLEAMLRRVDKLMENRQSKKGNKQVLHIEKFHFKALFHICSNEEYEGCDLNLRNYDFVN